MAVVVAPSRSPGCPTVSGRRMRAAALTSVKPMHANPCRAGIGEDGAKGMTPLPHSGFPGMKIMDRRLSGVARPARNAPATTVAVRGPGETRTVGH